MHTVPAKRVERSQVVLEGVVAVLPWVAVSHVLAVVHAAIESILIFDLNMARLQNLPLRKVQLRVILVVPHISINTYNIVRYSYMVVWERLAMII
jgi:hypothetical protein